MENVLTADATPSVGPTKRVTTGQAITPPSPFALSSSEALLRGDLETVRATVSGHLPTWLHGDLYRTGPAIFDLGGWHATHWFDGLGMIEAFRIDQGRVSFDRRLLGTQCLAEARADGQTITGFGTPTRRSLANRLLHPSGIVPDNANVNIVPNGDEMLALTETPHQLRIDRRSLAVLGRARHTDMLPSGWPLAHPHFDRAKGVACNLWVHAGASSWVGLTEEKIGDQRRRLVGKWRVQEVPYLHSFGLTDKHAVVFAGPLAVAPLSLLFSQKGFIDHFRWKPSDGTAVTLIGRETGEARTYKVDPLFSFHVINAYETGEETVCDIVAYTDPAIINAVRLPRLWQEPAHIAGMPTRLRMDRNGRAKIELLSDVSFEFPQIAYRRMSGQRHTFCWGAENRPDPKDPSRYVSRLVKLDVNSGLVLSCAERGWIFGEPIFIPTPAEAATATPANEDSGVLLALASEPGRDVTILAVVDAETMSLKGWAEAPMATPLGLHGSWRGRSSEEMS